MYAGIDYSMKCPAITIGNSKDFSKCKTFYYLDVKKFEGKMHHNIYGIMHFPYLHNTERYSNIADWIISILKRFKVHQVCMEGYAMGAKGQVFDIAENTGILKYKIWKENIDMFIAPPKTVKKHFTGNGNANKIIMFDTFLEKNKDYDLRKIFTQNADKNPISDIVDSYAMLCYGIDNNFK